LRTQAGSVEYADWAKFAEFHPVTLEFLMKSGFRFLTASLLLTLTFEARERAAAQAHPTLSAVSSAASAEHRKSKLDLITEGMKTAGESGGLFKMWYNDQRLLILIKSSDLDREFIVLTSIAKGISHNDVIGGMSWGFDDDVLWVFKKVGDNLHVLRRNVRFLANPGTPEADAVSNAYSDSVLYSLPIVTDAEGGHVVDFTRAFMNDDQMIGRSIGFPGPPFHFVSDRSTWAKVKVFKDNAELRVAAVYSGMQNLDTVIDPRGTQIQVHYGLSRLPSTDFKSRKADDRVGYFLTVRKNFSDKEDDQHFVRYINRWNLKKESPESSLSAPVKPITFYIEKTVPKNLRPYVTEGILEWNKAFEKLGYYNAIHVYQPGDYEKREDEIDPEDINYNFFRWITAEAGFAMGPSRVNPKTGEILDADIIFDDSFLRYWKQEYEVMTPQTVADLFGHPISRHGDMHKLMEEARHAQEHGGMAHRCTYSHGMQHQMGFAASVLMARGATDDKGKLPEEFIHQALKEVVMHEVGHTLGLRHNFKASAWKDLKDLSEKSKAPGEPIVASVMDYNPANISATGSPQGYYYTPTIGPYDYWAIEYGYKEFSGSESSELGKVAARGTEPALQYATDEDVFFGTDPLTNTFDLGHDPMAFANRQMKLSSEMMPKLLARAVKKGEGYQKARQAFNKLFGEYWRTAEYAAKFPGGLFVHRDHDGDPHQRAPFALVDVKQQRDGMKLLSEHVFSPPKYDPKLLNYLPATHWLHWGLAIPYRQDYPIDEYVGMMQEVILFDLLNSETLSRLHDNESKVAGDGDRYTLAEHLRLLVESVFAEWKQAKAAKYTDSAPYIAAFRRNLQRMTLKDLAFLVQASYSGPEDARTLARMHLAGLDSQITGLLTQKDLKLDDYSRAHLLDSQKRIHQILNAQVLIRSVD
jgi:Met-zincin/Domain of unknown function (DUF5117)